MYFPKLSDFLEKWSPLLTTFVIFGNSKVNLDSDLSVMSGGDKFYVES
jgi:hypothetical protein